MHLYIIMIIIIRMDETIFIYIKGKKYVKEYKKIKVQAIPDINIKCTIYYDTDNNIYIRNINNNIDSIIYEFCYFDNNGNKITNQANIIKYHNMLIMRQIPYTDVGFDYNRI